MVFQCFAPFPWLSVLDNVEIGLRTKGAGAEARPRAPRRSTPSVSTASNRPFRRNFRAACASASVSPAARGSIRQSFLMDEPFSALDVLTAETLRTDLLDLWVEGRVPIKIDPDGDAQHRGGGADVQSHPRSLLEPRPHRRGNPRPRCPIRAIAWRRNSANWSTASMR